jgi:Fe-S-cluster-containing dehydrogenase component
MSLNRRDFLKVAGAAGCTLLAGHSTPSGAATAGSKEKDVGEFYGMLIDSTKCIGCRSCEEACNAQNKLPPPKEPFSDEKVLDRMRDTTPDAFTVINRFPNRKEPDKPFFVRKQCMHCAQPACATACLTKALEKKHEGMVKYNPERCMGCRFCMLSCPFDVPKYQYDSPSPFVRKCIFCYDRVVAGDQPACSEACPEGATLFGRRRQLVEIAKERIATHPDRYHSYIYGEHEAGGTSWMYIGAVPPTQLGLRDNVGTHSYPEKTSGFLYAVPHIFILWPAFLYGLSYLTSQNNGKEEGHGKE